MGNTPSIEAQQRVPQKLSKPRVGNAVSGPSAGASSSTPGLHSSSIPKESIAAGSHNSNPARFSTFRPAPPPDLHPYAPAPSTLALSASHVDPALVDQSADRMASGTRERIRRSLFRSRSSQGRESTEDVAPRERRLSVGPRDPVTGHRLSRTNSLAAEHEGYASYMGRPATEDK